MRAFQEQAYRGISDDRLPLSCCHRLRESQRSHPPDDLTFDPQRLATRSQNAQLRARAQQLVGQRRTPREYVLAVIQHQQQPLGLQYLSESLKGTPTVLLRNVQRGRSRLGDERRVRLLSQLHQ